MANNIKITQTVDLALQSGKLDVSALEKEFPKLINQALAKLPGTTAVIKKKLKIDPDFDTAGVAEKLRSILASDKIKASSTDKEFTHLTKVVEKYATALEKLSQISTNKSFTPNFLGNAKKFTEGTLAPTLNTETFQRNLQAYRDYSAQLQQIFKQIQSQIINTRDAVPSVDFRNAKTALTTAKRIETLASNKQATNIVSGITDPKAKDSLDKATRRREQAQMDYDAQVESGGSALTRIGAHIDPEIQRIVGALGSSITDVDKAVKKTTATADKEITANKAAANLAKYKPQGATRAEQIESLRSFTGKDADNLAKAITRVRTSESHLPIGQQTDMSDLIRDLRVANTRINTEHPERLTAAEAKKDKDEILARAENAKRNKRALDARDKEETLARVKNEARNTAASVRKEQTEVLAREENNRRVKSSAAQYARDENAARIENKKRDKALADEQAIARGREAYQQAGRDVRQVPPNSHTDVRAALNADLALAQKQQAAVSLKLGISHPETQAATAAVHSLAGEITALNREATHLHPVMDKVGRVIGQFAKYALGYGALYKVTQALGAMASEVVNLDDKLKSIQAITGSTTAEMSQMAASIKQVAVSSAFSIADIADAVKIVAQAGTELKDIPKTLQAVSDLASASSTSLQSAADVITTVKSVWESVGVTEIADRVTQAANVSKLAVEDLSTIFSLGASFAKNANVSLDQYLGVVATLRNSGVKPSTIATGTSQFLTEVTAPDKQFSGFLSKRYKAVGEDVSSAEAAQKFAGFKYEQNPILAALNELKRLGVDTAAALPGLQRSIDKRGFNIMQPLLANLDKLQETSGRLSTAPTAQESAKVAMDSLKKASENLADQFNVLADTLSKDTVPALTKLVKGMSAGVAAIDDLVIKANLNRNGEASGIGSVLTGAVVGGIAGWGKGKGAWKIGTTAVGALAGGVGTSAVNNVSAANENDSTTTSLINAGIWAYTLSRVKWVTELFGKVGSSRVGVSVTAASAPIMGGINAFLGRVGTKIAVGLGIVAIPVMPAVGAIATALATIWGALELLVAVADLFKSDERKLADLEKLKQKGMSPELLRNQLAKETAKSSQSEFTQFATGTPDSPAPVNSIEGQVSKQQRGLENIRQDLGMAVGQPNIDPAITNAELTKKLQVLSALPLEDTARKAKLAELQKSLGGKGKIDQVAVQAAIDASAEINGAIAELVKQTAQRYKDLIEKGDNRTATDARELEILRMQESVSPNFRAMLAGHTVGLSATDQLKELKDRAANGAEFVGAPPNLRAEAKARIVDVYKNTLVQPDVDTRTVSQEDLKTRIRSGITEFGPAFGAEISDALARAKPLGELSDAELKKGIAELIPRLIQTESSGNLNAVSKKGARGLTQILQTTGDQPGYGVTPLPPNPTPAQQIQFTKDYLFGLAKAHPEMSQEDLLARYNGQDKAEDGRRKPVDQKYVDDIKGSLLTPEAKDPHARTAMLDTIAEELLLTLQNHAKSLTTIQDNATEQSKNLALSDQGKAPITFDAQTGKRVTATPLAVAQGLATDTPAIIKGLTEGGGGVYDKVRALIAESDLRKKEAMFEQLRPELTNLGGIKTQIDNGALQVNPEQKNLELNPNNRVERLSNKQANLANADKEKTEFIPDEKTLNKILALEEEVSSLQGNLPQIKESGLYGQIGKLQKEITTAHLAHISANGYSPEEIDQGVQAKDKSNVEKEQRANELAQVKKEQHLNYQLELRLARITKEKLDKEIAELEAARTTLAKTGTVTGSVEKMQDLTDQIDAKRKQWSIAQKNLTTLQSKLDSDAAETAIAETKLKNLTTQQNTNQASLTDFQSRTARISSGYNHFGNENLASNSYQQAIGQDQSLPRQRAFVESQVADYAKLAEEINNQLTPAMQQLATQTDATGQKYDLQSAAWSELVNHTQQLSDTFGSTITALAEAKAKLADLNPNFNSELGQVSATSIGAKIADQPGSLKNLNKNIENRFVMAVDGLAEIFTTQTDKMVKSVFGLTNKLDTLYSERNAIGQAQLNLNNVQTQGLQVSAQITDIKNNESDPARQEMLIKQATSAQAGAEATAQLGVTNAQQAYNLANYNQSPGGQLKTVVASLLSGLVGDMTKGMVTNVFSKLFTGFGVGKRGESKNKPIYTLEVGKDASSGSVLSSTNGVGGSLLGSITGAFGGSGDGLWSSVTDLFLPSSDQAKQDLGPGAGDLASSAVGLLGNMAEKSNPINLSDSILGTSGKRGDTKLKPLFVSVTNGGQDGKKGGGGGKESSGGFLGGIFDSLTGGIGDFGKGLFGGLTGTGNGGVDGGLNSEGIPNLLARPGAGVDGGLNSEGIPNLLARPGASAAASSEAGIFDGLFGGGGGTGDLFGGLVSAGTSLFGLFSMFGNNNKVAEANRKQDAQEAAYMDWYNKTEQLATGGFITGPGTSTSDSIPAYLSHGEYVLNGKTTNAIGKDTLDKWNFGHTKPAKFATGGMVSASAVDNWNTATMTPAKFATGGMVQAMAPAVNNRQLAPVAAPVAAPATPQSMRVVLVDDHRKVADYINSPAGEKTMVDFVRKNSLSLKQVLQG